MYLRAVVQRVTSSSVSVESEVVGTIGRGFLVLIGVTLDDTDRDVEYMADKIANMRVFDDEDGKLNLSIMDVGGEVLAVSQFTLYGDCRSGRRPSFTQAAPAKHGMELYIKFVDALKKRNIKVEQGIFGADMKVSLVNDGPVTMLLESRKAF